MVFRIFKKNKHVPRLRNSYVGQYLVDWDVRNYVLGQFWRSLDKLDSSTILPPKIAKISALSPSTLVFCS